MTQLNLWLYLWVYLVLQPISYRISANPVCQNVLCESVCLLPNDPYVFIGERLILNCTVLDSEFHGNLSFTYGNDVNISPEHQRLISDNTLQLDMPTSDGSFNGVRIDCWGECFASQVIKMECEGLISQNIYDVRHYLPRKVTNWTVIIDDWDNLTLKWELGEYIEPKHLTINTMWAPDFESQYYMCSKMTSHSCFLDEYDYMGAHHYTFLITITNSEKNRSATTNITITSSDYVKPAKVHSVEVINETDGSITLRWLHNRFDPLKFRIQYTRGNTTKWVESDEKKVTIPGLKTYTKYQFMVFARSSKTTKGYWSDPGGYNYTTREGKPKRGPSLPPGSFYVRSCSGNRTQVSLYPKPPDVEYRNGELTVYTVSYKWVYGEKAMNFTYPSSTLTVDGLPCDTDYNVTVTVFTAAGPSPATYLHVSSHVPAPRFVGVLIPVDNTSHQVYWRNSCGACNWTVYWCQASNNSTICQGAVNWRRGNGPRNHTNVNIPYRKDMNFAISQEAFSGNTGMAWASCFIHLHDKARLMLADTQPENGLRVHWTIITCAAGTMIRNYVIQHCHNFGGNTICENENVSSGEREHWIQDLKVGVVYEVRVKLIAVSGTEGVFSEAVTGVPHSNDLLRVLSIVVAAVLVLLVLLLAVCLVKFRSSWGQRESIQLPRVPQEDFSAPDDGILVNHDSARISMKDTDLDNRNCCQLPTPMETASLDKGKPGRRSNCNSDRMSLDYAKIHLSTCNDTYSPLMVEFEASSTGNSHIPENSNADLRWDEPWDSESGWSLDSTTPYVTA